MYDNFEVITTTEKDKRDEMFEDLKRNGNALERQVVKFSGNELIADGDGLIELRTVRYETTGYIGDPQTRLVCRSTWSLAYPRTDENGKVPAARPSADRLNSSLKEMVEYGEPVEAQ